MNQPRKPTVIVAAVAVLLAAVIAYQALTGNDPHTTTSGPTPK